MSCGIGGGIITGEEKFGRGWIGDAKPCGGVISVPNPDGGVTINFPATNSVYDNSKNFKVHAVTLTLIGPYPMSNSSELFPYTTVCSSFKWVEPLFFWARTRKQI